LPAPMKPMTTMVGWIWRMPASLTVPGARGRVGVSGLTVGPSSG
jgi:hypothetical protein